MPTAGDPHSLKKARRARETLAILLLSHPDVSLIDIGRDSKAGSKLPGLAVRVHVRQPLGRETLGIPEKIDGVPVHILAGNYRLN